MYLSSRARPVAVHRALALPTWAGSPRPQRSLVPRADAFCLRALHCGGRHGVGRRTWGRVSGACWELFSKGWAGMGIPAEARGGGVGLGVGYRGGLYPLWRALSTGECRAPARMSGELQPAVRRASVLGVSSGFTWSSSLCSRDRRLTRKDEHRLHKLTRSACNTTRTMPYEAAVPGPRMRPRSAACAICCLEQRALKSLSGGNNTRQETTRWFPTRNHARKDTALFPLLLSASFRSRDFTPRDAATAAGRPHLAPDRPRSTCPSLFGKGRETTRPAQPSPHPISAHHGPTDQAPCQSFTRAQPVRAAPPPGHISRVQPPGSGTRCQDHVEPGGVIYRGRASRTRREGTGSSLV